MVQICIKYLERNFVLSLQDKLDKIEEVVKNNSGKLDDLLVCNSCNATSMDKGNMASIKQIHFVVLYLWSYS